MLIKIRYPNTVAVAVMIIFSKTRRNISDFDKFIEWRESKNDRLVIIRTF